MKKVSFANRVRTVILAIVLLGLIISLLSSCRTGYGCRGNQSWGRMVRRINAYGYVPNIKRHTRKEVDKAMSYSTWEYDNTKSNTIQSLK
jgi:hypothetical protein